MIKQLNNKMTAVFACVNLVNNLFIFNTSNLSSYKGLELAGKKCPSRNQRENWHHSGFLCALVDG